MPVVNKSKVLNIDVATLEELMTIPKDILERHYNHYGCYIFSPTDFQPYKEQEDHRLDILLYVHKVMREAFKHKIGEPKKLTGFQLGDKDD